ncbi:cardiolipin synthase [Rhodobacteraceae bacterium 2376]|uniref:Cardiolipin synthase n=1 Tax=Rhabdonatronobacter sediminivivens TaxID=2743469 RepID=A0A7Z0I3F9_9RHOB|nr:cardiolipin synthase [Rhabdonatronobacter sediminivivens]NYS26777.1 cardiolipin synthase [Rhabdonatronobacter sediminivivens]
MPTGRRIGTAVAAALVTASLVTVALVIVALNLMPDRRELREPVPPVVTSSSPEYQRTLAGLFGTNLVAGNRIQTLSNGDEIFPAMIDAIVAAQDSINFETYVYWDGSIAEQFARALMERARAGVEVRVMLDWVGSQPMDMSLIHGMEAAGVQVVRFRPVRWYTLNRINNRTHRKLLIVDGRVGFTGGVGIGDQWLGDARNPAEWRELHFRVTGPVVAAMQGAFVSNWVEDTGEILQGPRYFPELAPEGETVAQLVLSATGSRNYMHMMLMTAFAGAENHIRIATPYMVPDDVAKAQLLQARERGVEVEIIVPGEHMDKDMVRNASRHFWGPLLEAGVRIHEYQPTFMHAKLIVIDEVFASVGSTNFDERSFRLNDEANLNVFDPDFAREQIGHFSRDLERSRQVTLEDWQDRPLRTRLADWAWSWLRAQF